MDEHGRSSPFENDPAFSFAVIAGFFTGNDGRGSV
jgi:hypothetical protein